MHIWMFSFLLWIPTSFAADLVEPFRIPSLNHPLVLSRDLGITVPYYADLLPEGGKLDCRFPGNSDFGYLFRRVGGQVWIEVINRGESEGEKTRMLAEEKDYGSPFIHYLSVYRRSDNYASYLEFLVEQKISPNSGKFPGAVMFTEAFYEMVDGKEVETLKPLHKKSVQCSLEKPSL
jgi:hypothetical protein